MTKEELVRFCSADTDRLNMSAPWSDGEYSYATNGHVIVRVPRMEGVPEGEEKWKKMSAGPLFPYSDSPEWLNLADIELPTRKEVDCSECHGDREITHEDCPDCEGHSCETCGGTGKVTPAAPVSVGASHYSSLYLTMLKELPNCKLGPSADPLGQSPFRFDGGDGLLMPMNPAHTWKAAQC